MHDFLSNIGRVLVALWRIGRAQAPGLAHHAWDFYALWASRLTRISLIVVVGQPVAVILVSLTGVHELTVLTALTPIIALLFLSVVASMPHHQDELAAAFAIGTGLAVWDRTAKILEKVLQGLLLFLLLDMAFGLYFSLLPVEEDKGLVLWIVFVGVIFLLSVALLPQGWRKKLTNTSVVIGFVGSVVALTVVIPAVLANGGRDETRKDISRAFTDDAKAAPAETKGCERSGGVTTCSLSLPADGSKSDAIRASDFDGKLAWEAIGPAGTLVCPDNDSCVRLSEGAGAQEVIQFARKGGGRVTVVLTDSN